MSMSLLSLFIFLISFCLLYTYFHFILQYMIIMIDTMPSGSKNLTLAEIVVVKSVTLTAVEALSSSNFGSMGESLAQFRSKWTNAPHLSVKQKLFYCYASYDKLFSNIPAQITANRSWIRDTNAVIRVTSHKLYDVSNHWHIDCLFNNLFGITTNESSIVRIPGNFEIA